MDVPFLGSGLGFRPAIRRETLEAGDGIDFLEIIAEGYVKNPERRAELMEARERFTLVLHGVSLSIASARAPDRGHLRELKRLCDLTGTPYFSEHLAMTSVPGVELGHLSPAWFTEDVLGTVIQHVRDVQDFLQRPLVLENVTYALEIPGAQMSQPEFFHRLVDATECGVLLDLTNLFINAANHGFDAVAFLDAMPLHAVVQVHLAGGHVRDGRLSDSHSRPVHEEAWALLESLATKADVRGAVIEHDADFPPFSDLLAQVDRARRILRGA